MTTKGLFWLVRKVAHICFQTWPSPKRDSDSETGSYSSTRTSPCPYRKKKRNGCPSSVDSTQKAFTQTLNQRRSSLPSLPPLREGASKGLIREESSRNQTRESLPPRCGRSSDAHQFCCRLLCRFLELVGDAVWAHQCTREHHKQLVSESDPFVAESHLQLQPQDVDVQRRLQENTSLLRSHVVFDIASERLRNGAGNRYLVESPTHAVQVGLLQLLNRFLVLKELDTGVGGGDLETASDRNQRRRREMRRRKRSKVEEQKVYNWGRFVSGLTGQLRWTINRRSAVLQHSTHAPKHR